MAIQATVETNFGERRSLYIRINNVETSNHGVKSKVLVRGFLSKEAFLAKKHYVWETAIECQLDINQPLWPQVYAALKEQLVAEDDPLEAKLTEGTSISDV